ncbi:MAG: sodium:solute symporter family protein [Candidatus Magasanikbacteria bacterium]
MQLHIVDQIIVGVYIIITLILGFKISRKKLDDSGYMSAGRKLTLPVFVMTLVTTWYGAIFGVGEMIFGYGLVGWVTQGLVWYAVYFIFALLLAKKIHGHGHPTVASLLKERIGNSSSKIAAVFTYIMTTPAPYVLSLGVFVQLLFGISLFYAVAISFLMTTIYVWYAGFWAVLKTDKLQFGFMYLGFILLIIFAIQKFGGLDFIASHVPATHLTLTGELPWQTIIVWGLLALWTLVDPNFYQRCFAAQDSKTAQRGIIYSILFWFLFDMMTLIAGLYARAAFPYISPTDAYMVLSQNVLPVVAQGIFIIGIFSIIVSTVESFIFASATIVSVDFLQNKYKQFSLQRLTRIGIVATLALSIILIFAFKSIIGIIYAVGTVGVSTLILPVLLVLFTKKKLNDRAITISMILASIASGLWLVEGWVKQEYGWPVYRWNVEPMYIGIATSIIVLLVALRWMFKKE